MGAGLAAPADVSGAAGASWLPSQRELLVGDALDKAWVLAQLVCDEFSCPPERIRNAAQALQDSLREVRERALPICAGDSPDGAS